MFDNKVLVAVFLIIPLFLQGIQMLRVKASGYCSSDQGCPKEQCCLRQRCKTNSECLAEDREIIKEKLAKWVIPVIVVVVVLILAIVVSVVCCCCCAASACCPRSHQRTTVITQPGPTIIAAANIQSNPPNYPNIYPTSYTNQAGLDKVHYQSEHPPPYTCNSY